MASRLNPYLSFDGDARDAMETYKGVFGGELTVSTFGDMGQTDEGLKDKVMHSQLETPSGLHCRCPPPKKSPPKKPPPLGRCGRCRLRNGKRSSPNNCACAGELAAQFESGKARDVHRSQKGCSNEPARKPVLSSHARCQHNGPVLLQRPPPPWTISA